VRRHAFGRGSGAPQQPGGVPVPSRPPTRGNLRIDRPAHERVHERHVSGAAQDAHGDESVDGLVAARWIEPGQTGGLHGIGFVAQHCHGRGQRHG
jgi:hypothetical protein